MISEIQLTKAGAERKSYGQIKAIKIGIQILNLSVDGRNISLEFDYTADYLEEDGKNPAIVGEVKMGGKLSALEDLKIAKEIGERWGKEKRLPEFFADDVLNAINYTCSTNAVLVTRAINFPPPISPLKISIAQSKA
ncbi:MAG: hypothetical protein N3F07_01090 [Candidatus Micrarchaeota archaeon]|nr:hypothetical protein [Candidatus Micrarchaeota archaeon]